MAIFERATDSRGGGSAEGEYVCLSCERRLDVQYYACPACGSYDVRRTKWVTL